MEKSEFRAVIKHFFMKGCTAATIKNELDSVHGTNAPTLQTIYNWLNEFKRGRSSTSDAPRSGRPIEVTTEDVVEEVHNIVLDDRRVKVREIAEKVGISTERVHKILHEDLAMTKLSARWVPRLLTIEQKRERKRVSKLCLDMMKRNTRNFLKRFVTVDETWVHHYTPESKQQSKQWMAAGERAPKKAKTVLSAGKVMATVFWDSEGIIMIDYLAKGKTITGRYYADLLDRFKAELLQKRPRLSPTKVLFHQDNAPVHTSTIAMAKIHELGFELVPHAPYSPDLAPCDYYLFPNLKRWLGGQKFLTNEDCIAGVNGYFADLDESYFLEGIKKLETRWNKCLALKGDYVEK